MRRVVLGFSFFILLTTVSLYSESTTEKKIEKLQMRLETVSGKEKIEVLNELADLYYYISPKKCFEYCHRAIELSRKLKDHKGEATALKNISWVYVSQGKYEKALNFAQKSLKISKQIDDKKGMANSLNTIGGVYWSLSHYRKAQEYFQRSFNIYEEIGDKRGMTKSLNNIGVIYIVSGNYDKALKYLMKSLKLEEELENKSGIASTLGNIGLVYRHLGNYDKALEYILKSLKLEEELGDKRGVASTLNNIGLVYGVCGDYERALEYLLKSLKLEKELGDKYAIGSSLNNLGNVYKNLKKYNKALEYYEKALQISLESRDKCLEGKVYVNKGQIYYKLSNFSESIKFLNKALIIGQELGQPDIVWDAYSRIAFNYDHQKEFTQALIFYKKAIEFIEDIRTNLLLEEYKSGFMINKIKIYEGLINLLVQLHQRWPLKGYDRESFYYVEKAKARALLDSFHEAKIDKANLSSKIREREKKISKKVSSIVTKLQRPDLSKEDRSDLFKELERAEDDYRGLMVEIRREKPRYADWVYPQPYKLEQVQDKLLDKKTALIEYFWGEVNSFMFLITKNDFDVYKLPSTKDLKKSIFAYLKLLNSRKGEYFKGIPAAKRLYNELILPFGDKIDSVKNLIIIPDGILYYLPFETLLSGNRTHDAENRRKKSGIGYLIENYNISYAPSTSVLLKILQMRKQVKSEKDLLAFANPVYTLKMPLKEKGIQSTDKILRDVYLGQGFRISPLPFSKREVRKISKYIRKKQREIYIERQAKEEMVKELSLKNYKIIHFATHGLLDEQSPSRSALVLTLDENPLEDGFLQAREICNLRLNANLVVLSACQTGKGKLERGEGVLGLTRSFFYAGSKSVLSTLWNINDRSTSDFMGYFYKYLTKGKSQTQALRLAKIKMIDSKYNHPFYWAAFVISGDCNLPIELKQ